MEVTNQVWILAGLSAVFATASIVFSLLFAVGISHIDNLTALQILCYIAPALALVALFGIAYFSIFYAQKLNKSSWDLTSSLWAVFAYGVSVSLLSNTLTGLTLVWAAASRHHLPQQISQMDLMSLIGIWFAMWAGALVLQAALYLVLGFRTAKILRVNEIGHQNLDFGISLPQPWEVRPHTVGSDMTTLSQDPTLHSPPRTPKSRPPSTRRSSSTRVGVPSSSITKKSRGSRRSSTDMAAFPAGEAISIDSAFDCWDTSKVHREMRVVIHSSPPLAQSVLEPIPGSRAESPANGLDGPFLPSSPLAGYSSRLPRSPTRQALGRLSSSSSSMPYKLSTPPSSPPNFSRPTSSHRATTLQKAFTPTLASSPIMREFIPSYIRPESPEPVPLAVPASLSVSAREPEAGISTAAATSASEPSTPKSTVRMRNSTAASSHHSRTTPGSIDRSDCSNISPRSCVTGSPGPSIVDSDYEEVLPTTIPSFVLSAGQRSSLVGYGKRKSVKRERSRLSLVSAGAGGQLEAIF